MTKDPVERGLRLRVAKAESTRDDAAPLRLSHALAELAQHLLTRQASNIDEALAVSERALALHRNSDTLLARADALERTGQYPEVVRLLEEAIPSVHALAQRALRDRIAKLGVRAWLISDDDAPFAGAEPAPPGEDRLAPEDDNLELAILNALLHAELISAVDAVAEDEFEASTRVKVAWLDIEPTPEQLATITRLIWEGGHPVQHSIYPQWAGEDGIFDIASLTGIERLPNLEELHVLSSTLSTLLPLEGLPKLRVVELGFGRINVLAPLAKIPSLTDVNLVRIEWPRTDANLRVIRALMRRGVRVTSYLLE